MSIIFVLEYRCIIYNILLLYRYETHYKCCSIFYNKQVNRSSNIYPKHSIQLQSLRTIIKKHMTCFYAIFTKNVLTTGVNLSMLKIHEHLDPYYHPSPLSTHIVRYKNHPPPDLYTATTHTPRYSHSCQMILTKQLSFSPFDHNFFHKNIA